jgi:L-threonylcarbamoyladenylate synthase
MKIINQRQVNLDDIVSTLKKNGLVIMPSETLYGAFVDATNQKSINKLNEYKARPFGKPYSVAVTNQEMAERYVDLNKTAKNLYKNFLPGPLTVVSKGKHKVAKGVESENGTLGIRIPSYKLILDVVKKLGKPITATSANASYQKRPYKIDDILENLSEKQKGLIDLIIDAGELPHNEPSTVIDTSLDDPIVLRQGEIKPRDKSEIISRSEESTQNLAKDLWFKYEKHQGQRSIIFALEGPMGTGKTIFTKGLAKALGIKEEVLSPTYDLVLNYNPGIKNKELVHIDTWRMISPRELEDLGFAKMINDKSVLAIEWAEKVADVIRKYNEEAVIIWVKIKYGKKENERLISWGII